MSRAAARMYGGMFYIRYRVRLRIKFLPLQLAAAFEPRSGEDVWWYVLHMVHLADAWYVLHMVHLADPPTTDMWDEP